MKRAIQEAKQGKRKVMLIIKGFRPMFLLHYPHGTNYFYIGGYDKCISVPDMCKLLSVDPKLIQDIYFYYRQTERMQHWSNPYPGQERREKEISIARKQVITNIFPFPAIAWKRESGATGEVYPLKFLRRKTSLSKKDIEQIREQCKDDKAATKSFLRHSRKKRKQRLRKEARPHLFQAAKL